MHFSPHIFMFSLEEFLMTLVRLFLVHGCALELGWVGECLRDYSLMLFSFYLPLLITKKDFFMFVACSNSRVLDKINSLSQLNGTECALTYQMIPKSRIYPCSASFLINRLSCHPSSIDLNSLPSQRLLSSDYFFHFQWLSWLELLKSPWVEGLPFLLLSSLLLAV